MCRKKDLIVLFMILRYESLSFYIKFYTSSLKLAAQLISDFFSSSYFWFSLKDEVFAIPEFTLFVFCKSELNFRMIALLEGFFSATKYNISNKLIIQ